MRMSCPACAEGTVLRVRYRRTGGVVAQCDCCPALWLTSRSIGPRAFLDQAAYRASHGVPDGPEAIEWVDDDWLGTAAAGPYMSDVGT